MFDELLDLFAPWKAAILLVIVLGWLIVPTATAYVFKTQRDKARAELALIEAESRSMQQRVMVAESENDRLKRKDQEFREWVKAHPAPKDTEALRRWLIEAGKR